MRIVLRTVPRCLLGTSPTNTAQDGKTNMTTTQFSDHTRAFRALTHKTATRKALTNKTMTYKTLTCKTLTCKTLLLWLIFTGACALTAPLFAADPHAQNMPSQLRASVGKIQSINLKDNTVKVGSVNYRFEPNRSQVILFKPARNSLLSLKRNMWVKITYTIQNNHSKIHSVTQITRPLDYLENT